MAIISNDIPNYKAPRAGTQWDTLGPFIFMHLVCFAAIWTGVTTEALVTAAVLYVLRVFGITGGFHRYFAHRTYKTSRVFQFIIAFIGMSSMQSGVLWWASKHRDHHRDSDLPKDAHSPRHHGFWGAHMGWIFDHSRSVADYGRIHDFTVYPELVWLDRNRFLPGGLVAMVCLATMGLPGLVVGFVWSTVAVYHATFMINSLAHVFGTQRYLTGDDSRNNWLLAIIAMGEGWHNNHHHYPGAARNGFFWWEVDFTYYILKGLEKLHIVWDLRTPPASILTGEKAPSSAIIDKVAQHIASTVNVDALAARVQARWAEQGRRIEELRAEWRGKAQQMKADAEAYMADIELPELPSIEELKHMARRKFANTPSLDVAAERAHEKIRRALSRQLLAEPMRVAA
ncbi:MAG: acyl-CoA desaturase [Nevskiales bacterium]